MRANDLGFIGKLLDSDSDSSTAPPAELLTLLHTAVQVSAIPSIQFILSSNNPFVDVNASDANGNTPLHLATMLGREEVVSLLMSLPNINDTVINNDGKQPVEMCRYPELAQAMQVSRAQFVEKAASEMKACFERGDTVALERLMSNPRASALLDINGQDPDTGNTVLHDSVRAKNIKLVQFILDHGGDPFRRDRKGKLPVDLAKDDIIKKMLKSASKNQSIVTSQSANEAPRMKGYLKKWTNYTGGYKLRFFVLENNVLSYYKNQDDTGTACRGSINMRIANLRLDSSEKQRFEIIGKGSVRYHLRANHPTEANRWVWALSQAIQHAKDQAKMQDSLGIKKRIAGDLQSLESASTDRFVASQNVPRSAVPPNGSDRSMPIIAGSAHSTTNSVQGSFEIDDEYAEGEIDGEEDFDDDDSEQALQEEPHKGQVEVVAHSIEMEIKILQDIAASVVEEREAIVREHPKVGAAFECYELSLKSLKNLMEELLRKTSDREVYFKHLAERESELRKIWEDNMRQLAEENDQIEGHLHNVVEERKAARKALRQVLGTHEPLRVGDTRSSNSAAVLTAVMNEDEDDEFFDAIDNEESSISDKRPPPVQSYTTLKLLEAKEQGYTESQLKKQQEILTTGSFHGYQDPPRTRLRLDEDDRPKISLWGILKSMIGKDMTKMTLPVSFNECTSLLQRVAEDMEYTDLLDQAALCDDSALRMVYVAAFAASEYSSTINRIAKPFNPLLGETYEYCRPDKGYRFMVEQVSHHPPVGAALAESARWDYYGESAVKSKFNGRSFDINPLGTWYLHIRPVNGDEEVITWKKVTSSVVGIITGSPVVDNYGDMIITNHTTGDECKLKFKQRGWYGSGAYEVFGTVTDKSGRPQWSVGGRWNDKIYGRKFQSDTESVLVQLSKEVEGSAADGTLKRVNTSSSTSKKQSAISSAVTQTLSGPNPPFLVWQNHPRPPAPFNLTPFAITLNAIPESLRPWVAPTDTRLRPDQRAMEDGQYDFAATEKNRLEEKQRARRKQRELEGSVHKPRWFVKSKHPITKEEYWRFNGEYWRTRENMGRKSMDAKATKKLEWPDVEDIF